MFYHFVKHNFKAKSKHGTHSPFVYQLLEHVIYDTKVKNDYEIVENLRNKLLQDDHSIKVLDLGAGSKVNNNSVKKIKHIALNALKTKRLAQLMYRFVAHFKPKNIIEFGTCLGVTTSYMAKAYPKTNVFTMEGCPETAKVALTNFKNLNLTNINAYVGDFNQSLPEVLNQCREIDFAFVDGNHQKDATLAYFNQMLPHVSNNSVLIFDDIYWSKEMFEAWEKIKANDKVTVTIDLFWIGLVFFKTDQVKEHFKIRF